MLMGGSSLVGSAPCRDPGPEGTLGLTSREGAEEQLLEPIVPSKADWLCTQPQERGGQSSAGRGGRRRGGEVGAQAPRAWGRRREVAEGSQAWVQTPQGLPARRRVETIQVGCGFRFYRVIASNL